MPKFYSRSLARQTTMKFWEEETKKSGILEKIFGQIKLASEGGYLHFTVTSPINNVYVPDVIRMWGYEVTFVGADKNKGESYFKVSW